MKRFLVGLTVVLLAAAVSAEAHRQAFPDTCGIKGATIVSYSEDGDRVVRSGDETVKIHACLRGGASSKEHRHSFRARRLVGRKECAQNWQVTCVWQTVVTAFYPRGRVAFQGGSCGYVDSHCPVSVRVTDLPSGRTASTKFVNSYHFVSYLDISRAGTAVWIDRPTASGLSSVRGLTLAGDLVVFDEGPDLTDLALSHGHPASTLYWKNAGELRSAQVP